MNIVNKKKLWNAIYTILNDIIDIQYCDDISIIRKLAAYINKFGIW